MKTRLFSIWLALLCLASLPSFARDRDDDIKSCSLELENINEEFSRPPMDWQQGLVTNNVKMTTTSLIEAYLRGIFPWIILDEKVYWFNPPMRGIIWINKPIEQIIPKRDWQFIRNASKHGYVVTKNQAFERTMEECAKIKRVEDFTINGQTITKEAKTWIKDVFRKEYPKLFKMGKAKSFEVWKNGKYAGGNYAVNIGGRSSGESMCSIDKNAAKLAMAAMILDEQAEGRTWIDTQQVNGFLGPLLGPDGKPLRKPDGSLVHPGWGAVEIPRAQFMRMVEEAEQASLPLADF